MTLNSFLRRLPELVVDNLVFIRDSRNSEFHIHNGSFKLHKVGYNTYDVRKLFDSLRNYTAEWDSCEGMGDVYIHRLERTLTEVRVILGDDVPDPDWE